MTLEETQNQDVLTQQDEVMFSEKPENEEEEQEEVEAKPTLIEKSSSYREESNYLSDLKEPEKKALTELKSKLEESLLKDLEGKVENASIWNVPLLPSKNSECTDVILLKFLRAREFKVSDAYEMIKKTLIWREDFSIKSDLGEEISKDLGNAAYMAGLDRENHPVCYNIFGVFSNEQLYKKTFGSEEKREMFLRWRFQFMEQGIEKLDFRPGGVSSILQVYDLKNCPGPSKKEIRNSTYKAIALLQDNYPELVAKNVLINVPFWYYAFYSLISPFLTQRSKSKFVVARPAKVTETLLKYIPLEEIPIQYGGLKRENDIEFNEGVTEILLKPGSSQTIEIPSPEVGRTLVWEFAILGGEVSYKEEFIPTDEGSYTIIIQKEKKMELIDKAVRNSFVSNEPGKVVLTVNNPSKKKKRAFYRFKN